MTRLVALLLLAVISTAGCDALEGPAGEEGPEGPQGPPGAANVESVIITYSRDDVTIEQNVGEIQFEVAAITEAVYSSGSVQIYYELSDEWLALPWTLAGGSQQLEMTYSYAARQVTLYFLYNQSTLDRGSVPQGRIKVVVIPPSEAAPSSSSVHKAENVAWPIR